VQDLDGQILARLAEDRLLFLLYDLARTVVGVDDVIADLIDDQLGLPGDLQILDDLFSDDVGRQGVLLAHTGLGRLPAPGTSGL
jgi:hypothetical protein